MIKFINAHHKVIYSHFFQFFIIVALSVEVFSKHSFFAVSTPTDFLETLPHDVCMFVGNRKHPPLHSVRCPLKEIRGQKLHFGDFFGQRIKVLQYHSEMQRNFAILKQIGLAYNADVHPLCSPNVLGGRTYNKGERLSEKCSFRPLGYKNWL